MKPIDDNNSQKKLKSIKKEYVFILIICIVVVILFFWGNVGESKLLSSNKKESSDYSSTLENKLKNILSDVQGVGKVNVFISVEGGYSEIVLKEIEESIENGTKTLTEKVVLVGGKPYVISTENPKILGVCVVCEGADDVSVKMKIVEILTTTLKLDADCVRIIKMK